MQLKDRFLNAVISGELGKTDDFGVIVELKEFRKYFNDIKTDYTGSFLPAATIEKGQHSVSHTRYLFRVYKGAYRIHPDAIEEHLNIKNKKQNVINKSKQTFFI